MPGRSETIIRSARASVLMNVDLPVLARPTTAIFIAASAGLSRIAGGKHLVDHLEQLLLVAVLVNRDRDRLAAAELVKLGASMVELGDVGLVHHQDDRGLQVAQPRGDLDIQRHHLVADIDDEEDQVGLVHRRVDLALDVLAQIVAVDHADPAGIEELDEPRIVVLAQLHERADAIAGHARHRVDDRDLSPRQPVKQRRLADVGPAHDHDLREWHGDHPLMILDGAMAPARRE